MPASATPRRRSSWRGCARTSSRFSSGARRAALGETTHRVGEGAGRLRGSRARATPTRRGDRQGRARARLVEDVKRRGRVPRGHGPQGRHVRTVGGRVLGVTALGANLESAIERAYEAVAESRSTGCSTARTSAREPSPDCTRPGRHSQAAPGPGLSSADRSAARPRRPGTGARPWPRPGSFRPRLQGQAVQVHDPRKLARVAAQARVEAPPRSPRLLPGDPDRVHVVLQHPVRRAPPARGGHVPEEVLARNCPRTVTVLPS